MCLIALAIGASSRWPLVIASNRDEFLDRPTLPLSRWTAENGSDLYSGRDLRAGGTWLGMTPAGRVAMLTNVREPGQAEAPRSRGDLPLSWLNARASVDEFLSTLKSAAFGGCNLVLGDVASGQWTWVTNRPGLADPAEEVPDSEPLSGGNVWNGWSGKHLRPGIYGLSNALLDSPWPKTQALKAAVAEALQADTAHAVKDQLWTALGNRQRFAPSELPRTGVALELEHGLSSAFVDLPERAYGTRCSTLVVVENPGADNAEPAKERLLKVCMDEKTAPHNTLSTHEWRLEG